jgi:hypothetical protein
MKKKILLISVLAAVLIILASLSSAIGGTITSSDNNKKTVGSPLFAIRINQQLNKAADPIESNYLGKGKILPLFTSSKPSLLGIADKAIQLIETKPQLLDMLLQRVEKMPAVIELLDKYDISFTEFKNHVALVKSNPSLLKAEIERVFMSQPGEGNPAPLGLSTSNPIGCFITAIALIPVALVLSIMIATITIITCLNIAGCLEGIFESILGSILQGLTPPGY